MKKKNGAQPVIANRSAKGEGKKEHGRRKEKVIALVRDSTKASVVEANAEGRLQLNMSRLNVGQRA